MDWHYKNIGVFHYTNATDNKDKKDSNENGEEGFGLKEGPAFFFDTFLETCLFSLFKQFAHFPVDVHR